MKKPVSIILAILMVVAVAFSAVTISQKNTVSTQANQLQGDLTTAQADIEKLTADNAAANEALAAAQAEVDRLTADNATANEALAAAQAEVDRLTADNATANEALAAAQAEVEKLTADNAAANEVLAAAQAEVEKLTADNAAANEALAAAQAEVERLTETCAATSEALAAAQAEVDRLTAELAARPAAETTEAPAEEPEAPAEEPEAPAEEPEAPAEEPEAPAEEPEAPAEEPEAPAEEPEAPAVAAVETDPVLSDARSYLRMMYKNSPETTMTDYDVVGAVNIAGTLYPITWTADSDTIKFIAKEDGMVTVDVDEKNPEEVFYVLTGTITSPVSGETAEVAFNHKVPAAMILEGLSYEEIVAAAYTLEDGIAMEEPQRLYGTIVKIPTPYSEQYGNITVDIQIGDLADQPIQCYRLTGEGVANLQVGDKITVEGTLKNYKGTIEFDKGCVLVGMGEVISQKGYLDAAYALEDGASMTAPTALEGEIVKIDTPWSPDYKNITVTIVCDGKTEQPIMCYRLSGEGAETLAVGDKITVMGTIKNYKGTIEFDKGCVVLPFGTAAQVRTLLGAYTLEDGLSMDKPATLTGVIVNIPTPYSPDYKNITVDIVVAGLADYQIQCYRLSGEGAETLAVGDIITVTGTIKNYKGTIEFDKGCTLDAVVKGE